MIITNENTDKSITYIYCMYIDGAKLELENEI